MANRANPPKIQAIRPFEIPATSQQLLPNGIALHLLDKAAQEDVLCLELIVPAGRIHENQQLLSRLTAKMLKMGTATYSADALSERLDFYGTKLKVSDGFDSTTLQFYCLHRHLPAMLDIMIDVFTSPAFAPSELEKLVKRSKELLRVDLSKADFVAYRHFTELIFGEKHPYGYNSFAHLYDNINVQHLREFHSQFYLQQPPTAVLCGNLRPELVDLVAEKLAALPTAPAAINPIMPFVENTSTARQVLHAPLAGNQQAAIRIGRKLFNKKHEDYPAFFILNTVLGGYFGARLMQNLREDKGYTYGVYSSVDDMQYGGYFCIDTEVGKDVADDAIKQIYIEIARLRDEPITAEELEMLRNYLMGNYLSALDGFFNRANTFSDAINADIDLSFLQTLADTTYKITAEEIQALAQKYLQQEDLTEVVIS